MGNEQQVVETSEHETWERVEEAYPRYEEAVHSLEMDDPELSLYRQDLVSTLRQFRAVLESAHPRLRVES